MKFSSTCLVFALLVTGALAEELPVKKITIGELEKLQIIGRLGVPLGQPVEVDAIVRVGARDAPSRRGRYYLDVLSVGGKALAKPVDLEFSITWRAHGKGLEPDPFSLYEQVRGAKVTSLSEKEIAELEKGYIGGKVRLLVHESGTFSGTPENLPGGPPRNHKRFGFSTKLSVWEVISQKKNPKAPKEDTWAASAPNDLHAKADVQIILDKWAGKSPKLVSALLAEMDPNPNRGYLVRERDYAIAVFCYGIAKSDLDSARVWAAEIKDEHLRKSTLAALKPGK